MDYKKNGDAIYIRIDKGEEIFHAIASVCEQERINGGSFQGIGACDAATLSTYIPQRQDFIDHPLSGTLEMICLMGNVSVDAQGRTSLHAHAAFSYLKDGVEPAVAAGHLKEARIGYTGEIVLRPFGAKIGRKRDAEAGIDVWQF